MTHAGERKILKSLFGGTFITIEGLRQRFSSKFVNFLIDKL